MAEIIKIDDNTWRIEDSYVRFFLLAGKNKAALIDSGVNSIDAKDIAAKLTDLPIMLINTHGDGDHISGTGAFAEIHMAKEDYYNKDLNSLFPDTKLVELKDRDVIDLGARTLEVIKIPGHTKGSVALLDVERRMLFSGDTVQSGFIFMFGNHRAPEAYEAALIKLINESERYDIIIPSHDKAMLASDYTSKVLEAWRNVKNGKVEYEMTVLHDTDVKAYATEHCGFYCDL